MNNYQFSVVIPLYNKGQTIKACLESVCRQTVKDIEIIVVDDGSTDNGAEVTRNYPDSRICLIQQENMGPSAARNTGISKAKADLIAFLDADDTWEPAFLETILRLRNIFPDAGAYTTSYYYCSRKQKKTKINLTSIPQEPWEGILPNYFKLMATESFYPFFSGTICVAKHVFRQIGDFFPPECEDLDMWSRIALNYPIAYSTLPGGNYCFDVLYDNAFTKERIKNISSEMQYIKTLRNALNNNNVDDETKKYIKMILSKIYLYMAKIHIIHKNRTVAINLLKNSNIPIYNKVYWIICALFPYPTNILKICYTIKQYIKRS